MLPDILRPGLRLVIANTVQRRTPDRGHYYAGPGNRFWQFLHEAGLTPVRLRPEDDAALPEHGIGLTHLVGDSEERAGREPERWWELEPFHERIRATGPDAVAWVSKTSATAYARAARVRAPRDYGAPPWTVAGVAAFVLPGPSGANNGMPVPVRLALWRDLADFLDTLR